MLNADYIRTARAKGLSERKVIYRHAFRNTLIPLVTIVGGSLPGLFSGALITETLQAMPETERGDYCMDLFYSVINAYSNIQSSEFRVPEHLLRETSLDWNGHKTQCFEATDIGQLNNTFVDYLNFGGYPEVAFNSQLQNDPGQYIRHDIIDKVLLRDLPSLYGISDVQELNSLFTMIAFNSGNEFSYESLASNTGVKKETLRKYVQYLEAAFLLKVIHRVDDTAKRYQREHSFKIYLTNPSLRCALFQPITMEDSAIGAIVETAIYAQWIPRLGTEVTYANWRQSNKEMGEVDIVGVNPGRLKPDWAVEVKWSDRYFESPNELRSLRSFMATNGLTQAVVTTMTQSGLKSLPWGNLQYMPSACYAYVVGRNTLKRTRDAMGL